MKLRELVGELYLSEREIHGIERKTGLDLAGVKDVFRKMR